MTLRSLRMANGSSTVRLVIRLLSKENVGRMGIVAMLTWMWSGVPVVVGWGPARPHGVTVPRLWH